MITIPVVVNHEEDELLASWLIRLANANAFDSPIDFLNAYIYPNKEVKRNTIRLDHRVPFIYFFRAIPAHGVNMRDLFLDTSVFSGI